MLMNNYTDDSIKVLEGLTGIREKLPMYIGSNTNEAVHHVIKEIITNSIDEHLAGYGNHIDITVNEENNSISITDSGRGIPLAKMDDLFLKIHSSGKFSDENYDVRLGLNGVGLKAATATGAITCTSQRDGETLTTSYNYKGKISENKKATKSKATGTKIIWTPDEEPFSESNEIIKAKVEKMVIFYNYVLPNLTFTVNGERYEPRELSSIIDNGYSSVFSGSASSDDLEVEVLFAWGDKPRDITFVNYSFIKYSGSHQTPFRRTFTREFNKHFNTNLKGDQIREDLMVVFNLKIKGDVSFDSQEKTRLNMPSIDGELSKLFGEIISQQFAQNKSEINKIAQALVKVNNQKTAKDLLKKIVKESEADKKNIFQLADKYNGCSSNTGVELYITEGDSAGNPLVSYKDHDYQGVMSIRGKLVNVHNSTLEEALQHQEIKDLISILGEKPNKKFDKIILATDSDEDGIHISVLLIGFLMKFYPELIKESKVYTVVTPRYQSEYKGKTYFAFNEEEKQNLKGSIGYLKGLGELDPEDLAEFVLGKNRILELVEYSEELEEQLDIALSNREEFKESRRELFR